MIFSRRIYRIAWLVFLLAISVCLVFSIKFLDYIPLTPDSTVESLALFSEDGCIKATWKRSQAINLSSFHIDVTDDQNIIVLSEQCSPSATSFSFTQGEHGAAYTVRVSMVLTDGTKTAEVSDRRLFLRYNELPNLRFLNICTENNVQPSYETIQSPPNCWGLGIVNNDYVDANMTITEAGEPIHFDSIRIRVRGNTSAMHERKPYMLKLDYPADLLEDGAYAHTEWLLLPAFNLKFLVGTETASLCGMEWQPRYQLVILMLNGDYLGTYLLTESVSIGHTRCNIDESGFLIELDAYWWNSDGEYFKIAGQSEPTGYTFKYPDYNDLSVQRAVNIRDYVNEVMHCLSENDPRYADYIDVESWAIWLLTHDILGTWDSGGSNLYYNKYDYDATNPTSTKLKMGPVWDFDTIYKQVDGWARVRFSADTGFVQLLNQPDFQKAYLDRWESISEVLPQQIDERLDSLMSENGVALEASLLLDSVRWQTEPWNLTAEIAFVQDWFASRVVWMNGQLFG